MPANSRWDLIRGLKGYCIGNGIIFTGIELTSGERIIGSILEFSRVIDSGIGRVYLNSGYSQIITKRFP